MHGKGPVTLITGPTGFVGQALSQALIETGKEIRYATRVPPRPPDAHFHTRVKEQSVTIGDIGPGTDWSRALLGIDSVVHLAARVHIMRDAAVDPLVEYRRVNVDGSERLALEAGRAGVRRLVFLSSLKVNGESSTSNDADYESQAFSESDPPRPEDPYSVSKWEAEQALARVSRETGLEIVTLRPPLVYGPAVKANFLHLLRLIDRGIPLPFRCVDNQRSLLYVGNLVDVIQRCIEHPAAAGQTFLVSDGEDVSTPDLIRQIASALDKSARLVAVSPKLLAYMARVLGKAEEVRRLTSSLLVDSSHVRETLGWVPPYSLEEGLKATADWYRELTRR